MCLEIVFAVESKCELLKNKFKDSSEGLGGDRGVFPVEYTCQLFLRYKREIFILGVLGFLKTTRSFPKTPKEVRSLPKKFEVFRRRPKSSENVRSLPKAKLSNAYP